MTSLEHVQQQLERMEAVANRSDAKWCAVCGNPLDLHEEHCSVAAHHLDRYRLVVLFGKTYRWMQTDGRYRLMPALR